MRVLIIKTSSMGDIIHTLPALTDAGNAIPGIQFDWVIEEAFADIPTWHPLVNRVIPIALRAWRKNIFSKKTWVDWRKFKKDLQRDQYDLIIDAQGLLKSSLISFLAKGVRAGFDFQSAREKFASIFYQKKYSVKKNQLAILRLRELFSLALGYDLPTSSPDFSLQLSHLSDEKPKKPYVVFLHGTTWTSKEYPVEYWRTLASQLINKGYDIKLSGKSQREIERAKEIADGYPEINFYPNLSIKEMAVMLSYASAAISVDTGFGHLAAALGIKTVAIFGSTNAALTGMVGNDVVNLSAHFICSPCMNRVCTYTKPSAVVPACFGTVPPERVMGAI